MVILSNDYPANLPGSTVGTQGGTVNFAAGFSSAVTAAGHRWVGILSEKGDEGQPKTSEGPVKGRRSFWLVKFPRVWFQTVGRLRKAEDPRVFFAQEIDLMRQVIRKEEPDIVFLNGFTSLVWVMLESARLEGVPTVLQHAGLLRKEVDIHTDLFTAKGREFLCALEAEIPGFTTHEVFLNQTSREVFEAEVGAVDPKRVSIIPLPLPKISPKRKPRTHGGEGINIGCVARWDRIKNHGAILRLAEEIAARGLPWKIHAITSIPETRKNLRMKAAYRRLVSVETPRPARELQKFYQEMDLMILPSHFDVSPTVVLEAAAAGRGTLISPGVGWAKDFYETGNAEWVIDFTRSVEVIQRIEKIRQKGFSSAFLARVKRRNAPGRVYSEYLKLFKRLARG